MIDTTRANERFGHVALESGHLQRHCVLDLQDRPDAACGREEHMAGLDRLVVRDVCGRQSACERNRNVKARA